MYDNNVPSVALGSCHPRLEVGQNQQQPICNSQRPKPERAGERDAPAQFGRSCLPVELWKSCGWVGKLLKWEAERLILLEL